MTANTLRPLCNIFLPMIPNGRAYVWPNTTHVMLKKRIPSRTGMSLSFLIVRNSWWLFLVIEKHISSLNHTTEKFERRPTNLDSMSIYLQPRSVGSFTATSEIVPTSAASANIDIITLKVDVHWRVFEMSKRYLQHHITLALYPRL